MTIYGRASVVIQDPSGENYGPSYSGVQAPGRLSEQEVNLNYL